MYNINDIYMHCIGAGKRMLSNFSDEFWNEYVQHYSDYDSLFRRKYLSFRYFLQFDGESISTVSDNFIKDVRNHLMVNAKKYNELYRTYVITDEQLSLTDNYYLEEKLDKDTTDSSVNKYGARTDSNSETIGARTDSSSNSIGAQSNTNSTTIGSQSNIEDIKTGAQHNVETIVNGTHTDVDTRDVSPYDKTEGTYTSDSKDTHTFAEKTDSNTNDLGARDDKVTTSLGARTDSNTENLGARSDTSSTTIGAQNNSNSTIKGAQEDNISKSGTEDYTLTRKGNIGTMAPIDMLVKSNDFWSIYEFYEMIFRDICKELLLV